MSPRLPLAVACLGGLRVYQVRVVEEGGQPVLRVSTPAGRLLKVVLRPSLSEAVAQLKPELARERVHRLACDGLGLAVGCALGRWAPELPWRLAAEAVVQLEGGMLRIRPSGAEGFTMALPERVEEAAAVLQTAVRAWPSLAGPQAPAVNDPQLAAGIVLGILLATQEPELTDLSSPAAPSLDRGPMPDHLEQALKPFWTKLVSHLRNGLPTEPVLAQARAVPGVASHPRAFDEWLSSAQRRGRKEKRALEEFLQVVARCGPDAPEVERTVNRIISEMRWKAFRFVADKRLDYLRAQARLRVAQAAPTPVGSAVRAGAFDHRIQALAPAAHWRLYIDESGDGARKAFDQTRAALRDSYTPWQVGVLVPEGADLPPLPRGFHARSIEDPETLDTHLQDLLDRPVGVFGLHVAALPISHGDAWLQGALELVRWVALLLPLAGNTVLEVQIEQRGDYGPSKDIRATADLLMRQLAEVDAARAAQLAISLRFVEKDAAAHLGYADLLAFAWGQRSSHTRAMMAQSGLLGTCLLEGDAASLRRDWEALGAGRLPDAAGWQRLVARAEARVPGSLVAMMLARVAQRAQAEVPYWRSLCEGVLAHLDGRDVNLVTVGEAVTELARCQPVGESLTPRLELAFRTARLWHANHRGAIELAEASALEALGQRLFEEVPTLVCQADLVRAVTHTNRFDFAGATAAIARWRDQRPEVAGLQHHGRLLSTLGQHAAFRGQHSEALALFEAALACFARLSEPAMASREAAQTGTYRAIALQDAPEADPDARRAALVGLAGALTPAAIAAWPGREQDPYIHHALLRWLVAHGSPAERSAYREASGLWAAQAFHPWELIEAYRGLLFWEAGDREQAAAFFESAIQLATAPEQGPTVQLIGAALARLAERLGLRPAEPAPEALQAQLPQAPWPAWEASTPLTRLDEAWAWLSRMLPFNFR
ncbi:MAG: hypothetical protein VKP62_15850 [Candidatus Sericytochromatia bacterium]|nr:hypothetical protein [Candidatus Sericytochromatia bacterium]